VSRTVEIVLVIAYNLALLAGASYLIVVHDFSAWLYLLALMFAAGWGDVPTIKVETNK
jgi:hypothetical protein